MRQVTFGDLIGLAREHLAQAGELDSDLDAASVTAAAQALARISRTLARYLADAAPYGVAETAINPTLPEWARAAVEARQELRAAAVALHWAARSVAAGPAATFEAVLVDADVRADAGDRRAGDGRSPGPAGRDEGADGLAGPPAQDREGPGLEAGTAAAAAPLVARLRAAGDAFSAGRDLLHTHVALGRDRERLELSEWAAVTGSPGLGRAVLVEVTGWSRDLALVAGRLSLAAPAGTPLPGAFREGLASACHTLLTAAGALSAHIGEASAADTRLLEAVPARHIPPRQPPAVGEPFADLAEGIARSAGRLRAITRASAGQAAWSPAMTADSWRWTASAAAAICHIASQVLGTLAAHPQLGAFLPGGGPLLAAAGEQAARAWDAWRKAVPAWSLITTETRGLTAPGVADVSDLALRLGRIAFTDPAWTPERAHAAPLKTPGQLAPGPGEFAMVIEALHHAADAIACVAEADRAAVHLAIRAHRLHQPTRTLPDRYDIPHKYGPILPSKGAALLDAYEDADAPMKSLAEAMGALATATGVPSRALAAARAAWSAGAEAVVSEDGQRVRLTDGPSSDRKIGADVGASLKPRVRRPPAHMRPRLMLLG